MSDFSETIYWLALIQESGLSLNVLKPVLMRWCITEGRRAASLLTLSPLELTTTFGLSDADAGRILTARSKLEAQQQALTRRQSQGIEPIIRTDPRYPRRLVHTLSPAKQPLVLWVKGAAQRLNQPGVTVLGQAGNTTAPFVAELLAALESDDIGIISGYTRGLDRTTFETMLATERGFTVAVLPMGLAAFGKTTRQLDGPVQAGRTVLVSPFAPDTPYQEKLADARNLIIDHMSLALLIPESDAAAQARANVALERGLPVFVKENTAENRELLDLGALLLTDAGEVLDWVQQAMVDDAMLEDDATTTETVVAAPLAATAPLDPPHSNEDYSLRSEDLPPIDSDEAIEVLSLGGEIPDILRQRLKKSRGKPAAADE